MSRTPATCRDCGSTAVRWHKTSAGRWVLMNTTGTQYDSGEWIRGPHAATCTRVLTRPRAEQMSATWPSTTMADGRTAWAMGGHGWVTLDADDKLVEVDEDQMIADLIAARTREA